MTPAAVRYIVVHCSATPPTMDVDAAVIDRWHRQKGWLGIGYHYVIKRSGQVEKGRPLDTPGAHVEGYNAVSVGVCLVGGVNGAIMPEDNFTKAQWAALRGVVRSLVSLFPQAAVVGHRDLNRNKACPSFDAKAWWAKESM